MAVEFVAVAVAPAWEEVAAMATAVRVVPRAAVDWAVVLVAVDRELAAAVEMAQAAAMAPVVAAMAQVDVEGDAVSGCQPLLAD